MNATYRIPKANVDDLLAQIAKLNKRAAKIHVAKIEVAVGPEEVEEQKDGRVQVWVPLTITGETPKYDGWEFVAVLEPVIVDDGLVNLIQQVPGQECPPAFRDAVGQCDHCQQRRRRNQTFVVRDAGGQHKAVGRQCLKDFLGHADPHQLAAWAELLASLDAACRQAGFDDGMGGGPLTWSTQLFMAQTSACIAVDGWRSRGSVKYGGGVATADMVTYAISPPPPNGAKAWREFVAEHVPTAEHEAEAEAAVEWAATLPDDEITENNYLANINAVARMGYVEFKTAGLAASIVSAYQREQGRLVLAARKAAASNEHVGQIKKREVFEITVENVIACDGSYGTTGLHKMVDAAGNDLAWFASGSTEWLAVGKTYKIKATVKKHDEYKGRKQTVLSRVAVVEGPVEAAAG